MRSNADLPSAAANDFQAVWEAYQDLKRSGAEKLSAQVWLDLSRQVETHSEPQLAADEYRSLAQAYPTEKQGLLAQIAMGRIYLKRLNRPSDALGFYEAAQASPVPHTEWKATIECGIADARRRCQPTRANSRKTGFRKLAFRHCRLQQNVLLRS
jgi:hypothetical protein